MKPLILAALLLCTLDVMAQTLPITNGGTGIVITTTNLSAIPISLPVVTKVETWLETAKTILASVLTLLTGLLAWWNMQMRDQGSALALLVRHIELLKNKPLEDRIKADAEEKGVETALNKVVKANTISEGPTPTTPTLPGLTELPK